MEWLVLTFSFRGQSASTARVGAWRRLKRFGAVSPRHGLWVLPRRSECIEAAQWLSQEVVHAGGEALVMTVSEFDRLDVADLVALFRDAAADRYRPLLQRIGDAERVAGSGEEVAPEIGRLQEELADIRRVDYFDAPEGHEATEALRRLRERLVGGPQQRDVVRQDIRDYRGRAWVTRPRPFVDRLACAWLIRRFIDPDAPIHYRAAARRGEVAFDMPGGEFEHVGSLCTFEVMMVAFRLEAPGLRPIADIVHEIDLRDGRFPRPETHGVEAILAGWAASAKTDPEIENAGLTLFDGLRARFADGE